ncbi:MAG: tRNA (adenosine(37)-N6)-dimethylallyltransferase MiaA [Firmicutes bacterium]|nr:tRNA (adenosine(37)-N6)-dimethylallyltransferase MiaA [Bacillota bacterium]
MIICVVGPTGVGKTKMSIELAKKYKGIIINCDAMQVYKDMDIATAKVTEKEKEGIKHYLLDICNIEDNYTIYDYQKDCRKVLEENKNKNIIIVGGSGLYLKSALFDYRFEEETENETYDSLTNEELYELALKKDKNMDIHINNRKRLIRFLNREEKETVEPNLLYKDVYFIGLTTDRENLYNIINSRVDKMVSNGLLDEAKKFYNMKLDCKSLKTVIGYKELFKYFDNEIDLEEAIELIKKNSRHYAKRQYTFFNNQMDIKWFLVDYNNFNNTIKEVETYIES